jgi:DNA-binding MurR/RpiR family transcriptional regulator
MELRIGVIHTGKELTIEIDGSADDVVAQIEAALKDGSPMLWLTDAKGRRIGTSVDKIAYVEVDADGSGRRVGIGR